jgi:hypothetical protein
MNKIHSLLAASALLMLVACGSDSSSSNATSSGLPTGQWLAAPVESDEGYTYHKYSCYTTSGNLQFVDVEESADGYDIGWYQGGYSYEDGVLSWLAEQRTAYIGSTVPANLTSLTAESMQGDVMGFSGTVSINGGVMTITASAGTMVLSPVTEIPAYMTDIPCN